MTNGQGGGSAKRIEKIRKALVDQLCGQGYIHDRRIRAAFQSVPRHEFVPNAKLSEIYSDRSIEIKRNPLGLTSSSTPPSMMAVMLKQLDARPGDHVLEIGTGSGYNAALLARLVGRSGRVTTCDIEEDLVKKARSSLSRLDVNNVNVMCIDGGYGYDEDQPYDRIIVTAAASDILPAWWDQLRLGGRIVVPLCLGRVQVALALEKRSTHMQTVSSAGCSFLELRGDFQGDNSGWLTMGKGSGLFVDADPPYAPDAAQVWQWLTGDSRSVGTGINLSISEYFFGLRLWMQLHDPRFCVLMAMVGSPAAPMVPKWLGIAGKHASVATGIIASASGLVALCLPPNKTLKMSTVSELGDMSSPFEVHVRLFGKNKRLLQQIVELIKAWDKAGRPFRDFSDSLQVWAYRKPSERRHHKGTIVVDKEWTRLVIDWPRSCTRSM